ncbi:MAG: agmatinase [Thermoplasmata archaeon]
MPHLLKYADSNADFEEAEFVIFGVPFDGTTSYRGGARFAPNAIREASINIESFIFEKKFSMNNVNLHDMGNMEEKGYVEDVISEVEFYVNDILDRSKFPIMLGGEHSITTGIAKALKERDAAIVFLDAHLDFRKEYLGVKYSHACVARRSHEILGSHRTSAFGVRSISEEEYYDALEKKYFYVNAYNFKSIGWKNAIDQILENISSKKIFLSLDIDGIDPAFAPAVATPEPYGLDPYDVKQIIDYIGNRLIGADIVEISPHYDQGNTAMLGARLVQEIVLSKTIKK